MGFGLSSLSSDGISKSSASGSLTAGTSTSPASGNEALAGFFSPDQTSYQGGSSQGNSSNASGGNIGSQLFDALSQEQNTLAGNDNSSLTSILQNILTSIEHGSAPGNLEPTSANSQSGSDSGTATGNQSSSNSNEATAQNPSIAQLFGPVFKQDEATQSYLTNQINAMGG